MKIILKGKTPPPSKPVKVDFFSAIIELPVSKLNQQLKKFGYKIIKIN